MLIGNNSKYLQKKVRAKSKMFEYDVPIDEHITVEPNAIELLLTTVGVLGAVSNEIWESNDKPLVVPKEDKKELEFSSQFFEALFQSKIENNHRDYYLLLGAIAYYFCDKIGSSMVLAREVDFENDFESSGIAYAILLLLTGRQEESDNELLKQSKYGAELAELLDDYTSFFRDSTKVDFHKFDKLKSRIYSEGTNRELLLVDALLAIFKKKITNSALSLMPEFSGMEENLWINQLSYQEELKELWPAQLQFGMKGIFKGVSGVVQMPTSSGKTTSIALTIQSAFISSRTNTAIVIAPFRALCKEISYDLKKYFKNDRSTIVNELSDIPNSKDLSILSHFEEEQNKIIVLTPEKLIYLLRHDKTLLDEMGLIVFDEAHLFDDISRGANYELLLSTIKYHLEKSQRKIQKLLISAVIPNSDKLNNWFNGEEGVVISDNTIKSSEKTIAFSDWNSVRKSGYLHFVNPENTLEEEFYVPRVVEVSLLNKLGRERNDRFFPEHNQSTDLGIYYAIKLNHNGGVAIFCGTKRSVNSILKRFLEIDERGFDISSLENACINNENEKLANLIEENYGIDNELYKAAQKGIFAHHAGISTGIRNSVEYALKNNLARCVVCTSTLAQGVNLPIKYLIVSSIYQAGERIKVRDFHNLIGRTGRAGKYTEGSIILSETNVYSQKSKWKFKKYSKLLNNDNSEDCLSNILKMVQPVTFQENSMLYEIPFRELLTARYESKERYFDMIDSWENIILKNYKEGKKVFEYNRISFESSLKALENYILDFSSQEELEIDDICVQIFGYYLANDSEKQKIKKLFEMIKEYTRLHISDDDTMIFSKAQLGIFQTEELLEWVESNLEKIGRAENELSMLSIVISQIDKYSENSTMNKVIQKEEIVNIASKWIKGESYYTIFQYCVQRSITLVYGQKQKDITLEDIIDICDNGLGYSSIMVVNAIAEIITIFSSDELATKEILNSLGLQMRYGLSDQREIFIYELGFSDRVVAQKIADIIHLEPLEIASKRHIKEIIRQKKEEIGSILIEFPSYFKDVLSTT